MLDFPFFPKASAQDRGPGTSGEGLLTVGNPPPNQGVSAAGAQGANGQSGSNEELALQYRTLKTDNHNLKAVNRTLEAENRKLQDDNRNLQADNRNLQADNRKLQADNRDLKTNNDNAKVYNGNLWTENQGLKSQVGQFNKVLESKEREHNIKLDEKRAQLEQKEVELADVRKTLSMYDNCSEAEITEMVEAIHTKIQSPFHKLARKWTKEASDGGGGQPSVTEDSEEAAKLGGVIGVHLVKVLHNSTPGKTKYAAFFLHVAWKACIVATVTRILSSFSTHLAGTVEGQHSDATLQKISGKVMNGGNSVVVYVIPGTKSTDDRRNLFPPETQPAYGRWRYVTHRYLKQVDPDEERAIQFYGNEALGYCRTAARLVMGTCCPDDHVFTTSFEMKLKEIMADAFNLLTTFQERWTTTNFEPYTPREGARFSAEEMEVGKQSESFDNDHVLCIIGLGLLYWGKKGRENTSGTPEKDIFKKVQVFTMNNLNKMINDG